jgi:ribose transport system substrate-binding protein
MRPFSRSGLGVLAGATALAVSACGSSSTSSSSSHSSAPASSAAATTSTGQASTSAAAGSSQVQAAAAAIAPYEKTPTSIGVSQPLTRRPTGKTFDYIDDGTPFEEDLLVGVKQAAAVLGVKLQVIEQQGDTPQAVQTAWNQVVNNPPAVVLAPGDPTSLYHSQLVTLHSKHVPVVAFFTNEDPLLAANPYGPPQYQKLGTLEADYVIAKSGGNAHVLVLAVPEIAGLQGTVAAMVHQFKTGCSGCSVSTIDTQLTDIGKTDPSRVVSYMQQQPNTNWIVFTDADTQIGVPEALAGAGIHGVSMLSGSASKVNYAYIKSGLSTAEADQPAPFSGWALVDAGARVLDGQRVPPSFYPMKFITKPDVTFNLNSGWPDVPGYEQKFEKLWGTGQ